MEDLKSSEKSTTSEETQEWSFETKSLISSAVKEDLGSGDVTSRTLIPEDLPGMAVMLAREDFILCGQDIARRVFLEIDRSIAYSALYPDGTRLKSGTEFAEIRGPMQSILSAERTALNFLQRLSGVATKTAQVCLLVAVTMTRVLDTRKTTPGFRELEKYAVRIGGGHNHRKGLYDAVLIKNNHIDALDGDIGKAIKKAREGAGPGMWIQVEVRNDSELEQALAANPDGILLDNMSPEILRRAVKRIRSHTPQIRIEASGGITEANILDAAETGVDEISVGALTHSARAVDISLRYRNIKAERICV